MRRIIALVIITLCAGLQAQSPADSWTLVRRESPARGLTLETYRTEAPLHAAVVKIALDQPGLALKAASKNGRVPGRATVQELVQEAEALDPSREVLAAINGDFFGRGGLPLGLFVDEGDLIVSPNARSSFLWSARAGAEIRAIALGLCLESQATEAVIPIAGVNRQESQLKEVLFTTHWAGALPEVAGASWHALLLPTQAPRFGQGLRVGRALLAPEEWKVGPHRLLLRSADPKTAMTLGAANDWILKPQSPEALSGIEVAITGAVRLLKAGSLDLRPEQSGEDFARSRHPRSAIGLTQDNKTLALIVVDGRQPEHSIGVSLSQLAGFCQILGLTEALNLDGGGSSALYADGGLQNRPSDRTGPRAVGNALLISAPRAP